MTLNTKAPWYVLTFAAVTSAAFTGGIIALYAVTNPIVHRNESLFRDKAMVELFDLAGGRHLSDAQVADLVRRRVRDIEPNGKQEIFDPQTGQAIPLIVAYDHDIPPDAPVDLHDKRGLIGYAFAASGIGFWDRINMLVSVGPDFQHILGLVVLSHTETPGLGGRISERAWRDSFRGLRDPPAGNGRILYIGGPKPAGENDPRYDRYVDAITGATGTSTAVERFLDERLGEVHRAAVAAGLASGGPASRRAEQP